MKKLIGVFFLLNFLLSIPVFAENSAGVNVGSDFRATKILGDLPQSGLFTFDFEGNYIFAQSAKGGTKIVKVTPDNITSVLVERTSQPVLGLSFYKGKVYAVFRGRISVINKGNFSDVVTGLPAGGDYGNGSVIFNDGKMYFSVGTATNSGIVGADNTWLKTSPSIHDLLCRPLKINQVNIEGDNFLTAKKDDKAVTGSFMPFNTKNYSDTVPGSEKCNGSIMRANPDGSNLELVAYGFHNPKGVSFDPDGRLYTLDSAMEDRGVRPVKDGKDALYAVTQGTWYGWPDYNAGQEVGNSLIAEIPNAVPKPETTFDAGHLSQFTLSRFDSSGLALTDNKIVEFKLSSGKLSDFAAVAPGYKINQFKFGPDDRLYVLISNGKVSELWKIESTKHPIVTLGTSGREPLPLSWSISITAATIIGLIGVYFVWRNRQQPIV
jgi:glucose/arabinose dehydrogenase